MNEISLVQNIFYLIIKLNSKKCVAYDAKHNTHVYMFDFFLWMLVCNARSSACIEIFTLL